MKVGICVGWKPQPSREPLFEAVKRWYSLHFPMAQMYTADRSSDFWHPGGSRNDAVDMAAKDGCDIVVVIDADTIPEKVPLRKAILAALGDNYIHSPYTKYKFLTADSTKTFIDQAVSPRELAGDYSKTTAYSGAWVCRPESWWAIGGMDEKFVGWGPEDLAMGYAHKIIHGIPFVQHRGIVYALHHQELQEKKGENTKSGIRLYDDIYKKISSPQKMLELVKMKEIPDESFIRNTYNV